MKFVLLIPARFNSTRFPGKPLVKINSKEMIHHVFDACNKSFKNKTYVLTDSDKIINFCKRKNIPSFKTSSKCKTGTDRIIEISKKIHANFYINVQGDEPLIDYTNIRNFVKKAIKLKKTICIAKLHITKYGYFNKNIPKIVTTKQNNLIYISRAGIPASKKNIPKKIYGQVNLYSYPKHVLKKKFLNKKTYLENIEDIEILRFLENGYKIKVIKVKSNNHPVDIPSDVKRVEAMMLRNKKK